MKLPGPGHPREIPVQVDLAQMGPPVAMPVFLISCSVMSDV